MNQITANNQNELLVKAVNDYLSNVQTKSGVKPSQTDVNNFLNTCIASKLNPFKRQAYLTGYDSKNGATFTTIIGIDGYRAIAMRTGLYAGGKVVDIQMNETGGLPESVTFEVSKIVAGHVVPFQATVYFDEAVQTDYNGNPNAIWKKRPRGQLIKCAEANALRMAFPDELGGMYTDAEIDPEIKEDKMIKTVEEKISNEDAEEISGLMEKMVELNPAVTLEMLKQTIEKEFKVKTLLELKKTYGQNIVNRLKSKIQFLEQAKTVVIEPKSEEKTQENA